MPAAAIKADTKRKPKRIVFDEDVEITTESSQKDKTKSKKREGKTSIEQHQKQEESVPVTKPQKIKFTDDGEVDDREEKATNESVDDEDDYFIKKEQQQLKKQKRKDTNDEGQKKWYNVYPEYSCSGEELDIKQSDQMELFNLCKQSFDEEKPNYNKRNPSDARWLHTALHKGTAKDRANAGALLVSSNPLGNLEALSTLIGFCKLSNKANVEVISIMTDLWKQVLLPPLRKLYSLQMRVNDWKKLRKDSLISKEKQRRIYAYWYFENELKDNYFEFLKNIMQCLQTGQENNKNCAIVAAAELLAYGPEKEQMLLTMLINKLGDPISKIASKALHHLTEVAHQHPNMCGVIITEAEKLLFRNNISDRAQHFTLCFLASIAPSGRPEVCTKLVNICFSLFKVLVQKGAVNNRIMQAILRCLQKAILDAKPAEGNTEILNKEMQDTIYRLVHLADIRVSVQTLGLLLQLVTVKSEKSDRFYNALYVKLLDLNLINIGTKTAAQLLHIVNRAIYIDKQTARPQAFIKRLLQLALYTPPQISAGCLIVLHKLLRTRPELVTANHSDINKETLEDQVINHVEPLDLAKFDSDGEEKYEDVADPLVENTKAPKVPVSEEKKPLASSWDHAKIHNEKDQSKVTNIEATKYDPYHRVPSFAGAEFVLRNELHLLRQHFHPTLQVFAENIITQKRIDYYGDPLRDFGLPHFLERFSFKNPKKLEQDKKERTTIAHKRYVSQGARGMPVKSLTKVNCTEDEMYIFNYLEHKRKQAALMDRSTKQAQKDKDLEDNDDESALPDGDALMAGEVDDNEFEAYLDNYFGKMAKSEKGKESDDHDDEENLDFLQELGGELEADNDKKKKKRKQPKLDDDDMSDIDADWGDDDDNGETNFENDGSNLSDDEEGSIDLDEEDNDDFSQGDDNDATTDTDSPDSEADSDSQQVRRRGKKVNNVTNLDNRQFSKKLTQSDDLTSLFAAADDFADLLEETGKTKGQGTINAVYNKDKSSDKQLKWEEKRRSDRKTYMKSKKTFSKTKQGEAKYAKKRKF